MVTKAKPFERPLIRSVIRLTSVTEPQPANRSCSSFSVVLNERFPTNNLLLIYFNALDPINFVPDRSRPSGFESFSIELTEDSPALETKKWHLNQGPSIA